MTQDSLLATDESDDDSRPKIWVEYLHDEVINDGDESTLVIAFPRGKQVNGIVDASEEVDDPCAAAKRIFHRPKNAESKGTSGMCPVFGDANGPVTQQVYQEAVRKIFMDFLQRSGFSARAFNSVDDDEVFVKIHLDRHGQMIKELAERYSYPMPFKEGPYTPEKCSTVYQAYEKGLDELLQDFREVDEIRLVTQHLEEWFDIEEMKRQHVITNFIPAVNHEMVEELKESWANVSHFYVVPHLSHGHDDQIRDYFGEEIAFFFRWFAFYLQQLKWLAVAGVFAVIVEKVGLVFPNAKIPSRDVALGRDLFGLIVIIWATVFNELFKNRSAQACLKWGMKEFEQVQEDRHGYNPDLVQSAWRKHFPSVAVLIYLFVFAQIIFVIRQTLEQLREGENSMGGYGVYAKKFLPVVLSLSIKIMSFGWNTLCKKLVDSQNHRTQERYNNSLTMYMSMVKITVALYPFISYAFLDGLESTCSDSLFGAAQKVFSGPGWPTGEMGVDENGTSIPIPAAMLSNTSTTADMLKGDGLHGELSFLADFVKHHSDTGKWCISGCFPTECINNARFEKSAGLKEPGWFTCAAESFLGKPGRQFHCEDSCWRELDLNLNTFYIVNLVLSLVFILIPALLTMYAVKTEQRKKTSSHSYTMTELEAKRAENAPYGFGEWGGSFVEDFLDLAISFALLSCFAQVNPLLTVAGFCFLMVQYRLLAYRITFVTCRPHPNGAEGIGQWQDVFESISIMAVLVNVCLAVFVMPPFKWLPMQQKYAIAFFSFITLQGLKAAVGFIIPDQPEDVTREEDDNELWKIRKLKKQSIFASKDEIKKGYDRIDVGLGDEVEESGSANTSESDDEAALRQRLRGASAARGVSSKRTVESVF